MICIVYWKLDVTSQLREAVVRSHCDSLCQVSSVSNSVAGCDANICHHTKQRFLGYFSDLC